MSSLAATQADGYHIPEEYYTSGAYKKKSVSQFNGSKGHNQYLQRSVVRFELPYDGFCTKCDAIVGKGTRFNAHKAHVDDYFSTKIYEFTTKCRSCGDKCVFRPPLFYVMINIVTFSSSLYILHLCSEFKIRTNPKQRSFDYILGIRKKKEEFDSAAAGTHGVIDTDFGDGIFEFRDGKVDAISGDAASLQLLEKNARSHRKTLTEHEQMCSLLQLNAKLETDADANAALRSTFRDDRKAKKRRLEDAASAGLGRGIEMSKETDSDVIMAKRFMQNTLDKRARKSERDNFKSLRASGIFGSKTSTGTKRIETHHQPKQSSQTRIPVIKSNKSMGAATLRIVSKKAESNNTKSASALGALSSMYGTDSDSECD